MKRIEQLQPLSKEHHQSLVLAQKAIKVSKSADMDAISKLCQEIVNEYPEVWKVHFQIEEDSIFQLFVHRSKGTNNDSLQNEKQAAQLCEKLQQEHLTMNRYFEQMKSGDYSLLGDFGELLKQHTRTEERQLFPMLDELLTAEELDSVYQTSLKYRQDC